MSAPSMRRKSFARSAKPSSGMCSRERRSVITMSSPGLCWPVPMRAIGAQNLLTMPGGVSSAGYLHKKGGSQFSLLKWPLRYIIIHKGCVYYFKSSTSAAPQGAFSLNGYNRVMRAAEETTSNNVFPFKVVHFSKKHRTWLFSAASEDERRKWMRHLRREIDHYNDRKESLVPCDSDSDADSFYGTIELPMDITHHDSGADDDYVEEDDDEEDYLEPDANCSPPPTGRPTGPPPSYPPPPVPALFQSHQDSGPGFHKAPPPPVPPQHRSPTAPLPKRPPPALPPPFVLKDPKKRPPMPPPPFTSHLHQPSSSNSPPPPPPPPPNPKRTPPLSKPPPAGEPGNSHRASRPLPTVFASTLPICERLEARMVLNGPAHCPLNVGGSQSLGVNHLRSKHPLLTHQSPSTGGPATRPGTSESLSPSKASSCLPPLPPLSPLLKPGLHNKPGATKPSPPPPPPPPAVRPPPTPAAKPREPGTSLQRASPEGQSFRSSGDETPSESRWKRDPGKGGGDDSDDDYEDVQLPDSVFIDTTETCLVEKLFREAGDPPEDGLYGIRNSGTKTSKVLVVWDVSLTKARNYRLFVDEGRMFLEAESTFPSLSALIEHYHAHPLPHHSSLRLHRPFTGGP